MKEEKQYRCKKCKVKCLYAPGVGHYCPECGHDWGLEEIKEPETHVIIEIFENEETVTIKIKNKVYLARVFIKAPSKKEFESMLSIAKSKYKEEQETKNDRHKHNRS